MDEQRLAEIEARYEDAHRGPWVYQHELVGTEQRDRIAVEASNIAIAYGIGYYPNPNMTFIAHAREDVPALVAEVRRLRALIQAECRNDGQCTAWDALD